MSIGEQRPPLGEAVNVRRLDLRMTAQATNPIILIIDGDKEDIRFLLPEQKRRPQYQKSDQ